AAASDAPRRLSIPEIYVGGRAATRRNSEPCGLAPGVSALGRLLQWQTPRLRSARAKRRQAMSKRHGGGLVVAGVLLAASTLGAQAKEAVKVGFIGPLTGGVSVNGLGGRNSADLAVRLRNADTKAKYQYELLVLDDECKPNVAVQQATKMAADKDVVAAATHYCSSTAIAAVDTYHKFGLPVVVWGAVLPAIPYRNT